VTNGNNSPGVKLQVWSCTAGPNQVFNQQGGSFLQVPNNVFTWQNSNLCFDLTDGDASTGNQVRNNLKIFLCVSG
jgi:hypothetical protein